MELIEINILKKDYISEKDFCLSCEAFIGAEDNPFAYEVYSFYVLGEERVEQANMEASFELEKGWFVQSEYNEGKLKEIIQSIISLCDTGDDELTYERLNDYLILQDS